LSSAKQNKHFLLLLLEKEYYRLIGFSFTEVGHPTVFCEAEQTLFASFSGKRRVLSANWLLGGTPPNPQGRLRRSLGIQLSSAKQNNAFCFFSGKRRVLLVIWASQRAG
jgi:hypothetical protein